MKSVPSPIQASNEVNVGSRLRELRTKRGLSIRGLAELSGLNVNTLSLIENGKTSPSVSTLQQIATALVLPIAAFFEIAQSTRKIVFQQVDERRYANFTFGALADLGSGFNRPGIEPYVVTLQLRAGSGKTPIVHTGSEFVYCLEGVLEYEVDGETYLLHPGDSLLFEAQLPHRWWNAGQVPTRSLLCLCPADERDRPDEQHFS